jgi:hypothetical protein
MVRALPLGTEMPEIDRKALRELPPEFCRERLVLPLELGPGALLLAMATPLDNRTVQDVESRTGRRVTPLAASESMIRVVLDLLGFDAGGKPG